MLRIEGLTEKNVYKAAELEKECFGNDAWSLNMLQGEIGQEDKHYFLFFLDDDLVAYGGFMQVLDEGDIMNIAVSKPYRRMGFGSRILDEFFRSSKELGIRSFTLEVRESNMPARSLYEKAGFIYSGVRRNYYRNGENCCIYWKVVAEDVF